MIWATFEQRCDGSLAAARGEVRYNATVPVAAVLTYPAHGSIRADLSQPFRWTSGAIAQAYRLYVGTTRGARDVVDSGEIQQTSYMSNGSLPAGRTLYARLWTKLAGVWVYNDSSFTVLPVVQSTVAAESIAPDWGTGATQTFQLQYSDTAGAGDLSTVWAWFSGSARASASSCLLFYDRAANAFSLLNDAGDGWRRATIGSSGALSNSQCFITMGNSTTAWLSGNLLTLRLLFPWRPPTRRRAAAGRRWAVGSYRRCPRRSSSPEIEATIFPVDRRCSLRLTSASSPRPSTITSTGWQLHGTWTVPSLTTSLVIVGEQGDYIAAGQALFFTPDDGTFTASVNYDNGVSLTFRTPSYSHWWYLDFAAPNNQFLTVGSYSGAARFPFQLSNQPGLSLSGDGRGCNTLTGSFDVKDVKYGLAGAVTSFWATFEQHCEGGVPAARGEIRFNAPAAK